MRVVMVVGLIVFAAMSSTIRGQSVTGSMEGRVTDTAGVPIPRVHIVISSTNLIGKREAVSDSRGYFKASALPPGEYTIRLTMLGLRQVVVDRLLVRIGEATVLLPLRMARQPVGLEPVRIIAPRQLLDPLHTDLSASISSADYSRLPGDRDYTALITTLPHANESYRGDPVNVAGATGLENMYFIDGLNVTAPLHAERGTSLPYNFVRAVEVKVGGYEAQYGEALGAVVNAVTYSGTNHFEAAGFAFATNSSLAADSKAEPTLRQTSSSSYDVGARLSGPVIRDVLWYSAAYNPRVARVNREITGLGVITDERIAHVFATKLTWNGGAGRLTELSFFGDPTRQQGVSVPEGVLVSGLVPLNVDPYLTRIRTGGTAAILRSTIPVRQRFVLDLSAGRSANHDSRDGGSTIAREQPLFVDYFAGEVSGGFGRYDVSDATRTVGTLRGTLGWRGNELIFGSGYQDMSVSRLDAVSGGRTIGRNAEGAYSASFEHVGGPRVHNRVPVAYIQNSWRLQDRLTLNTGIRWSNQTLVDGNGNKAKKFENEWQPRLGAALRIGQNGEQILTASAGRFYQTLPLNLASLFYVDGVLADETFATDPRVNGVQPLTRNEYPALASDGEAVTQGRKAEYFDELTLGYQTKLGASSRLQIRMLQRNLRSSFQWGFKGYTIVVGTPGEGAFDFLPRAKRKYSAVELSASGSVQKNGYRTSYVWSRSRGNYTGYYEPDFGFANPGGNAGFIAPHQAVNSLGLLPNDRPHVFKFSGWRELGAGVTVATTFSWQSGSPINEFAVGPVITMHRAFVVPRGSAGRMPALMDLNWRTTYDAQPAKLPHFRVLLDLLHVGNPQEMVQVDELHYQMNVNGVFSDENPNYRQPIMYQPPMEARVGLEFGSR